MKKRICSLLLSVIMCLGLLPAVSGAAYFRDVPWSHWASSYIEDAVDMGLFNGTSSGQFSPERPMTRAMFVTVLYRMDGGEAESTAGYTDVRAADWFSDAVAWASENGIVTGTSKYRFSPNNNVTREQMVTILNRYLEAAGASLDSDNETAAVSFRDSGSISSYARAAVQKMQRAGIVSGKPVSGGLRFDPQGNATRAEVACIMCRFLDALTYDDLPEVDIADAIESRDYAQACFEDAEALYADDDGLIALDDLSELLADYETEAKAMLAEGVIKKYNVNDYNIAVWLAAGDIYIHSAPIRELQEYAGSGVMSYEPRRGGTEDADKSFYNEQRKYGSIVDMGSKVAAADSRYPYTANWGGENVTVGKLKEWGAGSVVLWLGHGLYDKNIGPCLVTGETVTAEKNQKYADDRENGRIVTTRGHCYAVTSKFFDYYYKDNSLNGSLIWLGACDSAHGNRLTDALLNKGAATVIGNTNPAYIPRLVYMSNEFFGNLTSTDPSTGKYYTAGEALRAAKAQADINKIIDDTFSGIRGGNFKANELELRGNADWALGSTAAITGTVRDEDNKPIAGAKITVAGTSQSATTASDGSYSLSSPAANQKLALTAKAQGYAEQTKTITLDAEKGRADFTLQTTGRIKLLITAEKGESAIHDINCTIYKVSGGSESVVAYKSSTSRSITLYDLDIGQEYKVGVSVKGYEWAYATTTAEKNPTEIQVKLTNISLTPDTPSTDDGKKDENTPTTDDSKKDENTPAEDNSKQDEDETDPKYDGYTKVYTADQLVTAMNNDENILLMADVSDVSHVSGYGGILEGNGHTISDPKMYSLADYTAWLDYNEGTIRNVRFRNVSFTSGVMTPKLGLMAENYGTIENCVILSGTLSGKCDEPLEIGSFAAVNTADGIIRNCVNYASVSAAFTGDYQSAAYAGGICGYNEGTIEHCLNLGSVYAKATRSVYAAGIAYSQSSYESSSEPVVSDCGNAGTVSADIAKLGSGNYETLYWRMILSNAASDGYATDKGTVDYITEVSRSTLLSMWSDVLN